jgi:hypothetical protein
MATALFGKGTYAPTQSPLEKHISHLTRLAAKAQGETDQARSCYDELRSPLLKAQDYCKLTYARLESVATGAVAMAALFAMISIYPVAGLVLSISAAVITSEQWGYKAGLICAATALIALAAAYKLLSVITVATLTATGLAALTLFGATYLLTFGAHYSITQRLEALEKEYRNYCTRRDVREVSQSEYDKICADYFSKATLQSIDALKLKATAVLLIRYGQVRSENVDLGSLEERFGKSASYQPLCPRVKMKEGFSISSLVNPCATNIQRAQRETFDERSKRIFELKKNKAWKRYADVLDLLLENLPAGTFGLGHDFLAAQTQLREALQTLERLEATLKGEKHHAPPPPMPPERQDEVKIDKNGLAYFKRSCNQYLQLRKEDRNKQITARADCVPQILEEMHISYQKRVATWRREQVDSMRTAFYTLKELITQQLPELRQQLIEATNAIDIPLPPDDQEAFKDYVSKNHVALCRHLKIALPHSYTTVKEFFNYFNLNTHPDKIGPEAYSEKQERIKQIQNVLEVIIHPCESDQLLKTLLTFASYCEKNNLPVFMPALIELEKSSESGFRCFDGSSYVKRDPFKGLGITKLEETDEEQLRRGDTSTRLTARFEIPAPSWSEVFNPSDDAA